MRKHIYVMTWATSVLVSLSAGCSSSLQESEAVYVTPSVRLMGSVDSRKTEVVTASFRLHNNTNRPLKITKTLTSCTCTGLSAPEVVLGGGVADLTMKIKSARLKGHQRSTALVWTDNASFPYFELAAVGDFTADNTISPFFITLPPVTPGKAIHHEFEIPGLRVKSISTASLFDTLNIRFESAERDGNPFSKLLFDGAAPLPRGNRTTKLNITFAESPEPIDATVGIDVLDFIGVSPAEVNFGVVAKDNEVLKQVILTDRRSLGIRSVLIKDNSSNISIQETHTNGSIAKLKLKFIASASQEFVENDIRLAVTLGDGTVEEIGLPIRARIVAFLNSER